MSDSIFCGPYPLADSPPVHVGQVQCTQHPLTDEEKRSKIAAACPSKFDVCQGQIYWKGELNEVREREWLHAMHEAEKSLTLDQRDKYQQWLYRIVNQEHRMAPVYWLAINSTASQRAEAFGRTLGLWS